MWRKRTSKLRTRIEDSFPIVPASRGERCGDARQVGARGVPGAGRAVGHAVRGAGAAPRRPARAAHAPRAARARALRLRPGGRRLHTLPGARYGRLSHVFSPIKKI